MAKKLTSDKVLFAATVALVLAGIIMVFSASAVMANEKFHSPYYFLLRQGAWALLGLGAMSVLMHVDYHHYRKPILAFILLFSAGLAYQYVVGMLLLLMPPLFCLVFFFPYRVRRVLAFLDPWSDPQGAGFQIIQSLIAVGTGGLTGVGLMEGKQKL